MSRFHTQLDWLDSWHSFSFGSHHDPGEHRPRAAVGQQRRHRAGRRRLRHPRPPRHGDRHVGARRRARAPRQHRHRRRDLPGPRAAHERGRRDPPLRDERQRHRRRPPRADVGAARHRRASSPATSNATSTTHSAAAGWSSSRRARATTARCRSTSATRCSRSAGSTPGDDGRGARRAARPRVRRRGRRRARRARSLATGDAARLTDAGPRRRALTGRGQRERRRERAADLRRTIRWCARERRSRSTGRVDARGEQRYLWIAEAVDGVLVGLQAGRTRDEVIDHLVARAAEPTPRRRRLRLLVLAPGVVPRRSWLRDAPRPVGRRRARRANSGCASASPRSGAVRGGRARTSPSTSASPRRHVGAVGGIRPKSTFQIGGAGSVGHRFRTRLPGAGSSAHSGLRDLAVRRTRTSAGRGRDLSAHDHRPGGQVGPDGRVSLTSTGTSRGSTRGLRRRAPSPARTRSTRRCRHSSMSRHEAALRDLPTLHDPVIRREGWVWGPPRGSRTRSARR